MHHQFFTRGKLGLSIFVSISVILVFLSACKPQPPEPTSVPPPPATASFTATPLPPASLTPTDLPAPTQRIEPTAAAPSAESSSEPAADAAQASASPTGPSDASVLPVSASASPAGASSAEPTAESCIDKAAFYGDVTIPDDTGFEQAASFTKTWRFRNEGDCTWDSNYAIVFSGGEILNAPLVNPLAASVAPGQVTELSLEMRTPDRGGVFRGYWEFQNAQGARFGTGAGGHDPFWVQVVVSWMPPGGGAPGGSQANPGGGSAGSVGGSGGAANPSPTETPPSGGESSGDQPTPPEAGSPTPPPDPGQGTPDPGQGTPDPGQGTPDPGQGTPDPGQGTPDPGQGQSSLPGVPAGCTARDNNGYVQALLNLVNRARRDNNLEELAPSAPLYAAAAVHSADMACNNFINHIGSDGSSWYTRIAGQGYAYSVALENIVVGNPDFGGNAQYAFDWWMNSQVHRDNILNPKVRELGLGYVYNPDSEYGGYFTLVLARP